ncbi:DUF1990 domain-containing protein [Blastopirellula sp. J2-11]|uniref:DUF1990 family protein n=1 Tax=Blastopirellula sp. J2-11 TaxID=2943192 RepID=UPI0021C82783|nr:DUF1990 domain-containing protein [Blastopirellula sp. J2-11]UUO06149.1 DUF1990 domain-containing protein [Blastopirellula sp. J2-11]
MLRIRQPNPETVRQFLQSQASSDFSYQAVGATLTTPPLGYQVDHTRVRLGHGEATLAQGRDALLHWRQFQLGWVTTSPPALPIEIGELVAIIARAGGFWWLNACRIVQTIEEPTRFGFAYGTLPAHAESGEERFLIEMDDAGDVWYDILAFSRPNRMSAKLAYPYMRYLQKRFARDSSAAMRNVARA